MKQKKTTEWKSVESSIIIHLIIYYLFSMSRLTIFFSFRIAYGLTIFHEIHFEKIIYELKKPVLYLIFISSYKLVSISNIQIIQWEIYYVHKIHLSSWKTEKNV